MGVRMIRPLALVAALAASGAEAADLTVFAAASLKTALDEAENAPLA